MLEDILRGIPDDRRLAEHRDKPSPINDLLKGYNEKAERKDNELTPLEHTATGRDLKDAIGSLSPADQLLLLSKFSNSAASLDAPWDYETAAQRDERRLKHWVIKAGVVAGLFMIVCFTGAGLVLGFQSGYLTGPVFKYFIDTAVSILKIIFSNGGSSA